MPIYAYKCSACGHAEDVLQKMSAAPLTVCPSCGQATYVKQVTAAGFQLKGSGWYVTDFRGGNNSGAKDSNSAKEANEAANGADAAAKPSAPEGGADATAAPAKSSASSDGSGASTPAAAAPAASASSSSSPPATST